MMKLSEALRLGEFALKPAKGVWFARRLVSGKVCGGCAVGRAIYAAGYPPVATTFRLRMKSMADTGRVEYNAEYSRICCFVGLTWPWTRRVNLSIPLWENAVVGYISDQYETFNTSLPALAGIVERLEAKYDNNSVTMDVTPNVAGDATQLMEVL